MSDLITISSIEGNSQKLDGGAMFGNVPRALWSKWYEPDEMGRITLSCRAMLIEQGERKILCETGIGSFFPEKLKERFGVQGVEDQLIKNLSEIGVSDEEITDVILSHLHFDHAGGMLKGNLDSGDLSLHFQNARLFVGKEAWERARNPHGRDRASFIPELNDLLEASGNLNIVDGHNHESLPDYVSFFTSEGHTPGQMHTMITGKKERIVFAGDLIPGTHWVHLPITMGYDRFPEKLIDEKEKLYEDWEDKIIFFTHDANTSMGRLAKINGKYKLSETFSKCLRFQI
jgi:glyoxylase-like metal-dependent hydrolase (beta-lactamase superfamily II)